MTDLEKNKAFTSDHDSMMWNFHRLALRHTMQLRGNPVILLVPEKKRKGVRA